MHTCEKQNPILFYLSVLLYTLLALAIRVIALLPLAALVLDGVPGVLALLCPALLVFVVMPLRFSFAQAMVENRFSFARAFSFSHYGQKLAQGLLHALRVLAWGIPLFALGVYGYVWYSQVDAITLIRSVTELGGSASRLWCGVYGFFTGVEMAPVANGLMEGMYVVLGVVALAALIWVYGAVRNSSLRYIWALAVRDGAAPGAELRRRLKGRRMQQLLVALCNLALFIPFVWLCASALSGALSGLSSQLMMVMTGKLPDVDLSGVINQMAMAFGGLYLPLLPVRRMLTASFAKGEPKHKAAAVEE